MPDIGMMELLVIGVVALIVVGPKDLPKMFRRLGQITGRVRGMAREFSQAMNDAADEAGMSDLKRDLNTASKFTNPKKMAKDLVGDALDDIDPDKYDEDSEAQAMAAKRKAAQDEARRKARAIRAQREAEASAEPAETPDTPDVETPDVEPTADRA